MNNLFDRKANDEEKVILSGKVYIYLHTILLFSKSFWRYICKVSIIFLRIVGWIFKFLLKSRDISFTYVAWYFLKKSWFILNFKVIFILFIKKVILFYLLKNNCTFYPLQKIVKIVSISWEAKNVSVLRVLNCLLKKLLLLVELAVFSPGKVYLYNYRLNDNKSTKYLFVMLTCVT